MVGGQVTLSRKIGTESNLYGRIARGYKAGGFNVDLPADATDDQRIYDAEYLWNYEVGLKGRRGDGRAAWDLVAFWSDRRDQQVETSVQLDPNNPTTFVFYTDNAGSGTNAGVEASGTWRALPRLSLRASVGWLETQIDEFGSFENLRGRDQAYAPRFSYAAAGTWRGGDGRFARLDVVGKTSYYFDTSHDQRSDPYTLVHARVGIERDGWSAFLWGRNLFDEVYATRGFYFGNEPPDFPDRLYIKRGDPRQFGIALRFAL
jgi:outer membrane receptor protein involved in Fe transport